jgi:hypothetical protein
MKVEEMTSEQRAAFRQELLARSEARRKTLTSRIEHGFMFALVAVGTVASVASFCVKGHMGIAPKHAIIMLLGAPYLLMVLAYREPPNILVVGFYVAALLGLVSFVEWLGW